MSSSSSFGIELRQRSSNNNNSSSGNGSGRYNSSSSTGLGGLLGGLGGDYVRVNTEEFDDYEDEDFSYRYMPSQPSSSTSSSSYSLVDRRPPFTSSSTAISSSRSRRVWSGGRRGGGDGEDEEDEEDDDEDADNSPPIVGEYARRIRLAPKAPSNTCLKLCSVLSFAGIVFLSIIAYMLANSSPYVKVSPEYAHQKPKLVDGLTGAIFLYAFCLVISSYLWWRSHSLALSERDSRFMD